MLNRLMIGLSVLMLAIVSVDHLSAGTLVSDGQAKAFLVIPNDPLPVEQHAAGELQSHIQAMSGATLPIVSQDQAGEQSGLPVLIGRSAPDALRQALAEKTNDMSAFVLDVTDKQIALTGLVNPRDVEDHHKMKEMSVRDKRNFLRSRSQRPDAGGTQIAVYELLEQQGVRWFIPGELGTVIPNAKTVTIKNQRTLQVPSFPSRQLQATYAKTWDERMRHGGLFFPPSHGMPGMGKPHSKTKNQLFLDHPEYFSLVNGKRVNRQHCISNPEVVQIISEATKAYFRRHPGNDMMGLGANDGRGFCECENCRALDAGDRDAFGNYESMTDRYIWLFNQILDNIADEFPDKRLAFYAYSVYNRPPLKHKPHPNIVPAIALITLCRNHGMDNHICPEKQYEQWIIQQWGKLVPEVYYRGYWFNLADPGLPFFQISRIADEVPLGQRLNIAGWRVESPYNWAGEAPSRYIASKLMWNHKADVDALMQDFGDKFFGPASEPMLRYIRVMDQARRDGDYHTGSAWDAPNLYNAAVRKQADDAIAAAKKVVPTDSLYAQRVDLYAKSFAYLQSFIDMLESRNRYDFVAAKKAMDEVDRLREDLRGYGKENQNDPNPPMISRKAEEYLKRFFRSTTDEGYEKSTGDNRMIATFSDQWLFQMDPDKVGQDIGWHKPANVGGSWLPIATTSKSWSDQGLRYFKGDAWYRQTVNLPADAKGKRVFIWFGAIDEEARVWINGQDIGSYRGTFRPFDLDATNAIKPGEPNTVVVKLTNDKLNELGTGGILGPVMLYIPADPNAKPTGTTPSPDADTTLETIAE